MLQGSACSRAQLPLLWPYLESQVGLELSFPPIYPFVSLLQQQIPFLIKVLGFCLQMHIWINGENLFGVLKCCEMCSVAGIKAEMCYEDERGAL